MAFEVKARLQDATEAENIRVAAYAVFAISNDQIISHDFSSNTPLNADDLVAISPHANAVYIDLLLDDAEFMRFMFRRTMRAYSNPMRPRNSPEYSTVFYQFEAEPV